MRFLNLKLFAWEFGSEIVQMSGAISQDAFLWNLGYGKNQNFSVDIPLIQSIGDVESYAIKNRPYLVTPFAINLNYPLENFNQQSGNRIHAFGKTEAVLLTPAQGQPYLLMNVERNAFADQPEKMQYLEEQIKSQLNLFLFLKSLIKKDISQNQVAELLANLRKEWDKIISSIKTNREEYDRLFQQEISRKKKIIEAFSVEVKEQLHELKIYEADYRRQQKHLENLRDILEKLTYQQNLAGLHFPGYQSMAAEMTAFLKSSPEAVLTLQFDLNSQLASFEAQG